MHACTLAVWLLAKQHIYTVNVHIEAGRKYTQGLKYTPGTAGRDPYQMLGCQGLFNQCDAHWGTKLFKLLIFPVVRARPSASSNDGYSIFNMVIVIFLADFQCFIHYRSPNSFTHMVALNHATSFVDTGAGTCQHCPCSLFSNSM